MSGAGAGAGLGAGVLRKASRLAGPASLSGGDGSSPRMSWSLLIETFLHPLVLTGKHGEEVPGIFEGQNVDRCT